MVQEILRSLEAEVMSDEAFHIGFIAGRQTMRHDVIQALASYGSCEELRTRVMRAINLD